MKRTRKQFLLVVIATVVMSLVTVREEVAQTNSPVFDLIQLPANVGPEGIAVGNGYTFYVGSVLSATRGQILVGDLRTGDLAQLVPPTGLSIFLRLARYPNMTRISPRLHRGTHNKPPKS
jgi:hypothetical protein